MRLIKVFAFTMMTLSLMFSCTVTPIMVSKTRALKVESSQSLSGYATWYSLPRTVVDVEVVVEKKISKPGPFAAAAKTYLGLDQVITRERTEYRIKEIRVSQHAEKDPGQVYRIQTEGSSIGARVSLTPEGVIAGINLPWKPLEPNGKTTIVPLQDDDFYFPGYPDISIRKHIEAVADTTWFKVRTDTSFMNIPMLKQKDQAKTQPMQEKEAADEIYKLRKRRFYLLNGEYAYREDVRTPMPEGAALEIILKELAQMEYDYVSLFAGRTQVETQVHTFTYTPEGQGITEAPVLFAFSAQRGVLAADDTSGDQVRLQLTRTDENPLDKASWEPAEGKNPVQAGLAYRVPEKVLAELTQSGKTLFAREMLIAQWGRIDFLPEDIIQGENTCVEFYPAYGSVKSIYTK